VAHAVRVRTPAKASLGAAFVFAAAVSLAAQGTSPPAVPASLTFRAAMDLAVVNNLELAAVRRARHP